MSELLVNQQEMVNSARDHIANQIIVDPEKDGGIFYYDKLPIEYVLIAWKESQTRRRGSVLGYALYFPNSEDNSDGLAKLKIPEIVPFDEFNGIIPKPGDIAFLVREGHGTFGKRVYFKLYPSAAEQS